MTAAQLRSYRDALLALAAQYMVGQLRVTTDGHLVVEAAPDDFDLGAFTTDVTTAVGQGVTVAVQGPGMFQGDPL